MPWYKVTLTHADIAAQKHQFLQNAFTLIATSHHAPKDAAMFFDPTIGVHEYYFSPGAVLIAMPMLATYCGVECDAPARSSVRLLVGHDKSEAIPFAPEM